MDEFCVIQLNCCAHVKRKSILYGTYSLKMFYFFIGLHKNTLTIVYCKHYARQMKRWLGL